MTASLRVLLQRLIDYAGLYPPAALRLPEVLANHRRYLESPESWMLNRLVLPQTKLAEALLEPHWRVTLLVEDEPGPLPPHVETLEIKSARRLSLPTYCEAPVDQIRYVVVVDEHHRRAFAKIRMGETVPASEDVASFLLSGVPFKATAGLHHPIRAQMHGFINVFVAAALAWYGADRAMLIDALEERDARAFEFDDDALHWRGRALTTAQIAAARRDFAHSFGLCSFEEPVRDLRALEWLP